jgi:predicted ATPase/class 3 adenylate cyclase
MSDLPTGTVTFLFTDIEGSTRLWEEHRAAMGVALARHDAIVEDAITGHGGVVFSRMGDGMAAAFASPHEAIAAILAAQLNLAEETWPEDTGPLRVRMAVHTGEGVLVEGKYMNQPLNRCARLMAVAHGGQVVVSGATEHLVRGGLPEGVRLFDLGEHRLRDLSEPIRVFQVEHPEINSHFPPLRSLDALPGNLPQQVTSFVGRAGDLAHVVEALGEHRMVTLTGVGGVGKTRLALQVAAEVLPRFREGAWLIELAPVRDPEEVVGAFAVVFGVGPHGGGTLEESLVEFLRTKQLLLVVDNCEHLLDAVGDLIETLLAGCGDVAILATSREGLALQGEQILAVPSLAAPSTAADLDTITRSDAVSLFVQRARLVEVGFTLTPENAPGVAQVCRRLDGVPLAIELAAARVRAMSPAELASGLDRRFETLAGGRRRAVERHQTLRATIDWSFDLLSGPERHLLARLSVFAGGWTREAAEAICGGDPIGSRNVFDLLVSLVDRSLVVAERDAEHTRYRLLETIREYAEERLAEQAETELLRDRHAEYYAQFLGPISDAMYGPKEIQATKALIAEQENLVAAVNHAIDTGQVDLAMRLQPIGSVRVRLGSALYLPVEALLALPGAPDHPRYPVVLSVGAAWAAIQGDFETASARSRDATVAAERLGDPDGQVEVQIHITQAALASARGAHEDAAAHWERIVEIARSGGRSATLAVILSAASGQYLRADDVNTAVALATEGLALARQVECGLKARGRRSGACERIVTVGCRSRRC